MKIAVISFLFFFCFFFVCFQSEEKLRSAHYATKTKMAPNAAYAAYGQRQNNTRKLIERALINRLEMILEMRMRFEKRPEHMIRFFNFSQVNAAVYSSFQYCTAPSFSLILSEIKAAKIKHISIRVRHCWFDYNRTTNGRTIGVLLLLLLLLSSVRFIFEFSGSSFNVLSHHVLVTYSLFA